MISTGSTGTYADDCFLYQTTVTGDDEDNSPFCYSESDCYPDYSYSADDFLIESGRWWHWFTCHTVIFSNTQTWSFLPINVKKPIFYRRAQSAISGFLGKAMKRRKGK